MNFQFSAVKFCYVGIALILISTFDFYFSGDDAALLSGLDHILICLSESSSIPCKEVQHFPIFQYLVAIPLKFFGLNNEEIRSAYVYLNAFFSFLSVLGAWRIGLISYGNKGGHLSVLLLLSGYLIYYASSSFNEAASFLFFSILVISIIDNWNFIIISMIALLCTITKEVAFPFVIYFMYLAWLSSNSTNSKIDKRIIRSSIIEFLKEFKWPIFSVFVGISINLAFNYFRFGSVNNSFNLNPILFTPLEFIPNFFLYLFFSPATGLFFTWLSLILFFVVPVLFLMKGDAKGKFILTLSLLGLCVANVGLARWFSPFGWCAWGPRLTLPFLGAFSMLAVYIISPAIIKTIEKHKKSSFILIYFVLALSSSPNLAVRVDGKSFTDKMFAPTQVSEKSGIKNFTIQSAPGDIYFRASEEAYSRNVVMPITFDVIKKNFKIFFLWYSLILIIVYFALFKKPTQNVG